jgi:O-acetyl-ADP-ribose deacetylase (regulator of RNase III)
MANTLKNHEYGKLRKVLVVLYTEEAYKVFEQVFDEVLGTR